jgi:hypothetical protein
LKKELTLYLRSKRTIRRSAQAAAGVAAAARSAM